MSDKLKASLWKNPKTALTGLMVTFFYFVVATMNDLIKSAHSLYAPRYFLFWQYFQEDSLCRKIIPIERQQTFL